MLQDKLLVRLLVLLSQFSGKGFYSVLVVSDQSIAFILSLLHLDGDIVDLLFGHFELLFETLIFSDRFSKLLALLFQELVIFLFDDHGIRIKLDPLSGGCRLTELKRLSISRTSASISPSKLDVCTFVC